MKRFIGLGELASICALTCLGAAAAPRTMISDYTGLDCTINTDDSILYRDPDVASPKVAKLADMTTVHILGGKQFGPFVAVPSTDEEFARTWLKVRMASGKIAWAQSGSINCGG